MNLSNIILLIKSVRCLFALTQHILYPVIEITVPSDSSLVDHPFRVEMILLYSLVDLILFPLHLTKCVTLVSQEFSTSQTVVFRQFNLVFMLIVLGIDRVAHRSFHLSALCVILILSL